MLNTTLLKTIAECDSYSGDLTQDLDDLGRRKANLMSQKDDYSKNAVTVESELTKVNARLGVADTIIDALPDGPEKRKEEANKSKLTWRLKSLSNRKENFGVFAILDLEVKVAELDARLAVYNAALIEVATRKTELS